MRGCDGGGPLNAEKAAYRVAQREAIADVATTSLCTARIRA